MFLTSKLITAKHGFFTRQGGVSPYPYASLNCGFGHGDKDENVTANRAIVLKEISGEVLVTAKQIHSEIALVVNGPGKYEADALVTDKPGVALGILTADCVPILMHDKENSVIAAVHSGWRGARFGIIGSVVRAMQNLGAEHITAAIGPCIQQDSYEVGDDFISAFISESPDNKKFFAPSTWPDRQIFDLAAYVKHKLHKNGVFKVDDLKQDTLSQPDKFYSFRRKTLGDESYGSQISVICL